MDWTGVFGWIVSFVMAAVLIGTLLYMIQLSSPDCSTTFEKDIKSASISKDTEGSFALLGGHVEGKSYYYMYVEHDGGYGLVKTPAEDTLLKEGAENPRVVYRSKPVDYIYCYYEYEYPNTLHVPNGTVVLDYNVTQPGL